MNFDFLIHPVVSLPYLHTKSRLPIFLDIGEHRRDCSSSVPETTSSFVISAGPHTLTNPFHSFAVFIPSQIEALMMPSRQDPFR